jgi:hypothetical protein
MGKVEEGEAKHIVFGCKRGRVLSLPTKDSHRFTCMSNSLGARGIEGCINKTSLVNDTQRHICTAINCSYEGDIKVASEVEIIRVGR